MAHVAAVKKAVQGREAAHQGRGRGANPFIANKEQSPRAAGQKVQEVRQQEVAQAPSRFRRPLISLPPRIDLARGRKGGRGVQGAPETVPGPLLKECSAPANARRRRPRDPGAPSVRAVALLKGISLGKGMLCHLRADFRAESTEKAERSLAAREYD